MDGQDRISRAERLVDALLERRGLAVLVVLLATAGFGFAARDLRFHTSPETVLETNDRSLDRLREHEAGFGSFEHRLLLLVWEEQDVFAPESLERIHRATRALLSLDQTARVRSVTSPGLPLPDFREEPAEFRRSVMGNRLLTPFLVSEDGTASSIQLDLAGSAAGPPARGRAIDEIVATARRAGLDVRVTGIPAVREAYAEYIWASVVGLPPIEVLVLGTLLLLAIRRVLPLVALLLVITCAAVWTVGILALTGGRITALTSILPPLLMVVGIASGVHVVMQFLEERRRGADPKRAARAALVKMAGPCALTSLTTAAGFASLAVAGIRDVREFGIYSAAGAVVIFLLIPMIGVALSFLRDRKEERDRRELGIDRLLARLAGFQSRRPRAGLAAGALLALAAVPGILALESDSFLLEDVREDEPIRTATELVDEKLGGVIGFDVVLELPPRGPGPETLSWIGRVEDRLRRLVGVRGVIGPGALVREAAELTSLDPENPLELVMILGAMEGRAGRDLTAAFLDHENRRARISVRTGDVGSVRSSEIRGAAARILDEGPPEGVEARIGGLSVLAETVLGRLVREMAKSTLTAFLVILLMMSVYLRSFRAGLLSMVPNFLPLLVAAGFMGYTGITIRSSMALIFAVALGIAMDDTIHLLARYREERRAGRENADSIAAMIRWTGRPVVLSSCVLVVGFFCYLTMDFKATQQFGLIGAVTIASALVGDLLLLPSLLHLRGRGRA